MYYWLTLYSCYHTNSPRLQAAQVPLCEGGINRRRWRRWQWRIIQKNFLKMDLVISLKWFMISCSTFFFLHRVSVWCIKMCCSKFLGSCFIPWAGFFSLIWDTTAWRGQMETFCSSTCSCHGSGLSCCVHGGGCIEFVHYVIYSASVLSNPGSSTRTLQCCWLIFCTSRSDNSTGFDPN